MVALVRDAITDEPIGIHRTALTADGRKLDRPKLLGPTGGGAIKLSPLMGAGSELLIGEGIETTLSASILGFGSPAWSVIDAGGITRFPALPGIKRLTIAVDQRCQRYRPEGRGGDQGAMGGRGLAGPHRDAADARPGLQRRPGRAGGSAMNDGVEPVQVYVVDETEPEQPNAARGRQAFRRQEAREWLRRRVSPHHVGCA